MDHETSEPDETPLERFARIFGTPERGRRLWEQWMQTQPEMSRAVMEKLAVDTAAEQGISVAEARTQLAVQKLLQDRGPRYVQRFLAQHDAATLSSGRALRPMAPTPRRKSR